MVLIEQVTGSAVDDYRPLLSGYHRPLLSRLNGAADDGFVAIGAQNADRPCGILLCRVVPARGLGIVEALNVLPHTDPHGADPHLLLPSMFAKAEEVLSNLDCRQLRIDLNPKSEVAFFLPDVLGSRGYQSRDFWCLAADLSNVRQAAWSNRVESPKIEIASGWSVVGWDDLQEADRRRVLAVQLEDADFDDLAVEPSSSLAVRWEGRVCAWLLTHRLSSKFVRLQSIRIAPELRGSGLTFALVAESIRRQLATVDGPRGWYAEVALRDEALIETLQLRLLPFAGRYAILHKRRFVKRLRNASGERPASTRPQGEMMKLWKHVYSERSPFQSIAIKRDQSGFYLELDGFVQFHSSEEYRYHEALVHPPMLVFGDPRKVLILGGGDGLALREVLRYDSVGRVLLVDIDAAVTGLSQRFAPLAELNQHAFEDSRVEVLNVDALEWVQRDPSERYDVVLVDFPDPKDEQLARLYALEFFLRLRSHMGPRSTLSVQSSSISRMVKTFWCTARTVEAAGLSIVPYGVEMPLFGTWGFVCAAMGPFEWPREVSLPLRFLDNAALAALAAIGKDRASPEVELNVEGALHLARYHACEAANQRVQSR